MYPALPLDRRRPHASKQAAVTRKVAHPERRPIQSSDVSSTGQAIQIAKVNSRRLPKPAPSRAPAVIIGIVPITTCQRKFSPTICNDARGIYPIVIRGGSPRITSTVILNPCLEQARVICPCLGSCEAKTQSLLREGRGRVNEKMTHNERSHHDKNFHTLPPEGLCPDLSGANVVAQIRERARER
jgi:hypothetical protein